MIPGRKIGRSGLLELVSKEERATNAQKISNAVLAAGRITKAVLRSRPIIVSGQEQGWRLEICAGCEFFTGITCRKCGCVAKFKTKLATEKCPIGKW